MNRRAKETLAMATALLRQHGATDICCQRRGKHPCLQSIYRGHRLNLFLPGTPSDRRSGLNAIAFLKRRIRNIEAAND